VKIQKKITSLLFLFIISVAIFLSPHRVTAGEMVSVAISPLRLNAPEEMAYLKDAIRDMLSSRIGVGGEIHIVEEARVKEALVVYGGVADSKKAIRFLADKVGADYVVTGSLSVMGKSVSLDVKVIDVAKGKATPLTFKGQGLSAILDMVGNLAADVRKSMLGTGGVVTVAEVAGVAEVVVPAPAPVQNTPLPTPKGDNGFIIESGMSKESTLWRSRTFPRAFKAMEVADLDNDGVQELIVIDDKALLIYGVKSGKLALREEFDGEGLYTNYGITVADMNGNGVPEIYLSRMRSYRPSSAVLEMKDGKLKIIVDGLPWFIRTLESPRAKPQLIGQRFRGADGFHGAVKTLKWEGSALQAQGSLNLTPRMNLYGFTILNITGNGGEELLALDDSARLRLYEKGEKGKWKQTWRSPGYYGGSLNNIEMPTTEGTFDRPENVNLRGRIVTVKGRDGNPMVIINSNEPGGLGRAFKSVTSYKSGEILGLTWDGIGLGEQWRTREISGYIADYLLGDVDSDGGEELVILVVRKKSGLRGKRESFFMTYPLGSSGDRASKQ